MFDKIIYFSVHNKLAIGAFTLALIIWGTFSLSRLPFDAQPDITNNQVQIITQAPALGAYEVEQFITAPVELEMANLPDLTERRSISRAGISVITLVFHDDTDIYRARAQVSERLAEAVKKIPEGMGDPSLAPVTTGLGEIYQYVLHPRKGYEDRYSATDLRTMQDWIVRTQLAGTPGLAEVSGWGGYVKQYEIAVDNDRLNSFGLTFADIYKALEANNQNTGGSYIEQGHNAYAIRGLGLVTTLSDIEKIVVKNTGGIPVLIRDVATVQFGPATRYGAVTRNGEGEAVAGITLMLKGENFNEVIKRVKERMVQIQKSLPEGVVIEPYIDRTELVGRTIGTVKKNLAEGGLIVIFVLVLLLGNLRAGLIVGSVIPLSMLFAFSMMRLTGISGNLMSLGAIDFGLIVDGAVIIVEAIVHRIRQAGGASVHLQLNRQQMDKEVYKAASAIRNSAAFGEIIILIVYLPLFTLSGIEGKMFRPMAQTVVFAIAGAFILSLTYVPMMSALFLSRNTTHRRNISDRIMDFLQRLYEPALRSVLRFRIAAVGLSAGLFLAALFLFSRMGGEFIPTLEEGDLAVEISMMQGTSLTQAVETFSQAEKILISQFPEVKQVVTRIGSAEIPTDPMPYERGDMMIAMQAKKDWTSARTREEMAEKMEEALAVLPGVRIEITQPMQMRFNELMTGIRQDVAVKIYGDDLDELAGLADKAGALVRNVKGVTDPYTEKIAGQPQITVTYNRDKIAQYGLNIRDVNDILQTAFAGRAAGVVFEGEKRFDMVVRLHRDLRNDIANIENLLIPLPSGNKVPLNQVARIAFTDAPAQVSREEGKRRTYIGFNVRGRDIESTVSEINALLDQHLSLPPGYYIRYGGQFQNLRQASEKLSLAVPTALLLILFLLYLTFRSVGQALLIFTAVPLSAIGGVLALQLRDMPFSISAGVGFIALFGVAVLNGIVLIGYFNQLQKEGVGDPFERVLRGTSVRLRPVIMTASVASLGFLPMALSTSAGAEVQRPLATVVIGGLITATILTLFILPCLYMLFSGSKIRRPRKSLLLLFILPAALLAPSKAGAQEQSPTLDALIRQALKNNLEVRSSALELDRTSALQPSAFNPGATTVTLSQDPTGGGSNDNSISIQQSFALPAVYRRQKALLEAQTGLASASLKLTEAEIARRVRSAWFNCLAAKEKVRLLTFQDSVYNDFSRKASVRYRTGETSRLEELTALNRQQEVRLMLNEAKADAQTARSVLQQLLNTSEPIPISDTLYALTFNPADTSGLAANATSRWYRQNIEAAKATVRTEQAKLLPELSLGYAHQFLIRGFNPAGIERAYFPGTRIAGFQVGMSLPLFGRAVKARIQAEKTGVMLAGNELALTEQQIRLQYRQAFNEYLKYRQTIDYYRDTGLRQTDEQIRIARTAFRLGEIGYIEFVQNISLAVNAKLQYLASLQQYNHAVITMNYLKGELFHEQD